MAGLFVLNSRHYQFTEIIKNKVINTKNETYTIKTKKILRIT